MGRSLEEINSTVSFDSEANAFRKFLMYLGPGLLVAVGYMDPGNWITSMAGGAQFGYILLFIILLSSLAAMLLQSMSARLGVASGMDLAQVTKYMSNKPLGIFSWVLAELAIMATDIAEVIGTFFNEAPNLNPNRRLIKGVICGIRVEDIEEPIMQEIRYLDKLIDELAKGKKKENIYRKEKQ
ncbi:MULTISPECIES: Nramp family divalent metal transporter [Mammaliicoccus]|uniref:Nramp family divalent metal transporter n=1 Tax=Mammaliicoccus TaxID=2803850 RepID=UPI000CD1B59A|nr:MULTISPECIES: Nramp family divalent metal transporter [Mammaliicoccus]HBV02875.1 DUF2200 domain-containing protein [Staphylococcus sp.]MDQ7142053.1 Nramp family divalent metal transporter [Mammaliicoccus lentus]POA04697.1 hypothetical protein CD135_07790 [Mammaliicoccus lentus]WHI55047.1 Nramp family divalent metal transporter [Mammaliicoccus lentus]WHI57569.1 Nramp family divalent metal transporter [Mammaliicoccus lentus]